MSEIQLTILQNAAVAERTSAATRGVLEERAAPAPHTPFLNEAELKLLQQIVDAVLPQAVAGTRVDIAYAIDKRLAEGEGSGWRFAVLPKDGEAYRQGLAAFARMLEQTPMKSFERMPPPAREGFLRCVANGDVDGPAQFSLSRWTEMLRVDASRAWLSHPETMQKLELYGFADGASGHTDGPTETEGWLAISPNRALPFEHGIDAEAKR